MIDNQLLIHRVYWLSSCVIAILLFGTIGYSLIEGWAVTDGFYMSVITLATVGYGETNELSIWGRLFTCGLIFCSVACLSCWTACLTSLFVEGDLSGLFKRKRALKMAAQMRAHTIVCGTGVMARTVIEILSRKSANVVVVDDNAEQASKIRQLYPDVAFIDSKATDEMALSNANVLDAKCIVAALDSDFENLMIAMTCKDLGTDIKVVARAEDSKIASRLMKLGVEKVICPNQISGEQAANFAYGDV